MEQCLVIIDVDLSPGADPGLFKGGLQIRSTSKKRGGGQTGGQFWPQC